MSNERAAAKRAVCDTGKLLAVRVGPPATTSREPRQARKGAAVAARSGAGVGLTRILILTGPISVFDLGPGPEQHPAKETSGVVSYTVLAVKWRPRGFEDLVGQQHVVQALVNSLKAERLHHAYLFTGTRGVGKTTVARILAKALNCEQGVVAEPCGVCDACTSIDQGRFVDLLEVDAASRTKVDDTRELLDNVQYAPAHGRFKVYLIDEVHMLSNHSFNALLKTLEEPPPHVKFLLATTDPQKLPITVLSRCLQFNLKRLTGPQIEAQLDKICRAEGVDAEPDGLKALARAADGSMRDALSMLDQGIAFGGGDIKAEQVNAMLGTIDRGHVLRLLEALAAEDGAALLDEVERLDERAPDYSAVLDELMTSLQQLAVIQLVGDRAPDEDLDVLKPLAQQISAEDVQLYYQIALQGKRDLPVSRDPRIGVEMTLLRMLAFRPGAEDGPPADAVAPAREASAGGAAAIRAKLATGGTGNGVGSGQRRSDSVDQGARDRSRAGRAAASATATRGRPGRTEPAVPQARPEPPPQARSQPPSARPATPPEVSPEPPPEVGPEPPPPEAPPWLDEYDSAPMDAGPARAAPQRQPSDVPPAAESAATAGGTVEDWASLVRAADVRGGARQLADHCELVSATDKRLELVLAADKVTLNTQQLRSRLEGAISQHLGRQVTLTITPGKPPRPTPAEVRIATENARMRSARESMEQDPNVKAAQEAFGAVLEADSIQPTDDN
jgi:DNA polymerase III subunit gamma/tau